MEDHGALLTEFESIFGSQIEHEVIKIILQSCDWEPVVATEKFLSIIQTTDDEEPCSSVNDQEDTDEEKEKYETAPTNSCNTRIPQPSAWAGPINPLFYDNSVTFPPASVNKVNNESFTEKYGPTLEKINSGKRIMIILRGLPGSGKTTLAKKLCFNGAIHSADNFFIDAKGTYKFVSNRLSEAHEWNKLRTRHSLACSITPIIVDNTNTTTWEMEPYVKFAFEYGYDVEILEPKTPWRYNPKDLRRRCTHNVPLKKIEEMKARFEPIVEIENLITKLKNLEEEKVIKKLDKLSVSEDNDDLDVLIEDSDEDEEVSGSVNVSGYLNTNSQLEIPNDKSKEMNSPCSSTGHAKDVENMSEKDEATNFKQTLHLEEFKVSKSAESSCHMPPAISPEDSKLNSTENIADESNSNPASCNEVTDKDYNDLVNHFQTTLEKNLKQGRSLVFNDNDKEDFKAEGFSSDREVYEFYDEYQQKTVGHPSQNPKQSSENVITEENENISWDIVSPNDIASNCESEEASSKGESVPSPSRRERKRQVGDPNKWMNVADPQEKLDPSIASWVSVENGKLNWDASDEERQDLDNFESPQNIGENTMENNIQLKLIDCASQACLSDFASMNTESCQMVIGNPNNFKPGNPIHFALNAPLTKGKFLLEKGSMTEDNASSLSPSESLTNLHKIFPSISKGDLRSFLKECNYDIDWTVNLLIDSGYCLADNIEETQDNFSTCSDSSDTDTHEEENSAKQADSLDYAGEDSSAKKLKQSNLPKLLRDKKEIESSFSSIRDVDDRVKRVTGKEYEALNIGKINQRKSNFASSNESAIPSIPDSQAADEREGAQHLTLTIDPLFASQLVNIFGPVGTLSMAGEFSNEDRNVVLPLELCHQLYKLWSDTLDGTFSRETAVLDLLIKEDEQYARMLQEEEERQLARNTEPSSEAIYGNEFEIDKPTSFREIMDLEKALSLSNSNHVDDSTYSYTVKFQSLCEEFSHVDPLLIEEELKKINSNYHKTRAILRFKFGLSQTPQHSSGAKPKNCETNTQSNQEEFEDYEVVPENPQTYRDEANMHYRERNKAYQEAQKAVNKGMAGVAAYYAHLGNLHTQKLKEANERAASKILDTFNASKDANTIDLHLLHVPEALQATQSFLSERKRVLANRNLKHLDVFIITGYGKNSISGQGVLKNSIAKFLRKSGYSFSEFNHNRGMFIVKLTN